MAITPDMKNWTWVLEAPCPQCGFDASTFDERDVPAMVRANAARWPAVLDRVDVTVRPDDSTWSPLEYSAHVRDVFRIFAGRFTLMLETDDPSFADWDQDETAASERYSEQDPATVATQLSDAAEHVAALIEAVPADAWQRTGLRSDGARFTVASLAKYFIHDPTHHLWDVRG
jgi:hypothetical protein